MKNLLLSLSVLALLGCNKPTPTPVPTPTPTPTPGPQYSHARGFIKSPGQGLLPGAPFVLADRVAELPMRFNWALQYDLPVENQLQCGSCWAFSSVENMEWAAALFLGQQVKLSEQYMVSQMFFGCGGGDWGGGLMTKPGLPLEKDCPYQADNSNCPSGIAIALTAVQSVNIGINGKTPTIAQVKEAMLEYGPLSVDVSAGGDWDNAGPGDIITGDNSSINHMVVIYGWDDVLGVWEMRNSWGGSWGNKGSLQVAYNADSIATDVATVLVKPLASYKQWVNPSPNP